ncbi:MAG: hypothetical protein PUH55_09165 [Spirochaetales bacterium]|nr:hypothetical protein [Spirochaetales bacterium]
MLEICIGTHGLTYIMAMRNEVSELAYEAQQKQVQVDALLARKQSMAEGEGVQDAAFKLGYQREGEQVYFFDQPGLQEPVPASAREARVSHYVHLPLWANALIALAAALLSVILFVAEERRRVEYE